MKTSLPVEFYYLNNKWKTYLGIGGALIILLTMIYVNYLTQRLKEGESYTALVFSGAMENINRKQDLNQDFTFENDIIASIKSIPVILTDENMVPKIGRNYGVGKNEDIDYLSRRVQKLIEAGKKPLPINSAGVVEYLYYENSRLYTMLTYFPLFQGILLFGFIALGYIGFSNARRAEQNQVWVGMAKETAHQLGTPISAIMGWLQYLAEEENIDPGLRQEYLQEMSKDVDRLKLIADRFSKIGSTPELVKINLFEELDKCKEYMQKRSPKKVHFAFPDPEQSALYVKINPPLFDWVIENLVRNALDAMEGAGQISANVLEDDGYLTVDITDTGKGIPASKFKTVFQPGFTTKSRGWGLGLSLAQRIIEQYHQGKIFVKHSRLNEGTTFTIRLPKVAESEPVKTKIQAKI